MFSEVEECPVLRPTASEFLDFEQYIRSVEKKVMSSGIVRVVPPSAWTARASGYAGLADGSLNFPIKTAIEQNPVGAMGIYRQYNVEKGSMTFQKYRAAALSSANAPCKKEVESLVKRFWSSLGTQAQAPVTYAADIPNQSLFEDSAGAWDLRKLNTLLQRKVQDNIEGVTSPTLFVGMWRTCFAWHTEDYDLCAINFLHYGAPKQWWCIPQHAAARFQSLCDGFFAGQRDKCRAYLRHKAFLVSPSLVRNAGLPIYRCTQHPGEFVVVFPRAFHCGFNLGFNVAEACNFATPAWIPFGLNASRCLCRASNVQIDMRLFLAEEEGTAGGRPEGGAPPSLSVGSIVWARLPGQPAWPARVSSAASARQRRELAAHAGWLLVTFIGEGDWAVVPPVHVERFDEERPGTEKRAEECAEQPMRAMLRAAVQAATAEVRSKLKTDRRLDPPPAATGSGSGEQGVPTKKAAGCERSGEGEGENGGGERGPSGVEATTTQKLMETLLAVKEKRHAVAEARAERGGKKRRGGGRGGGAGREVPWVVWAEVGTRDGGRVLWPARVWPPLTEEQKRETEAAPGKLLVVWYGTGEWGLVARSATRPLEAGGGDAGALPPGLRARREEAEMQAQADVNTAKNAAGGGLGAGAAVSGGRRAEEEEKEEEEEEEEGWAVRRGEAAGVEGGGGEQGQARGRPLWYEGTAMSRGGGGAKEGAAPLRWLRAAEGLLQLAEELGGPGTEEQVTVGQGKAEGGEGGDDGAREAKEEAGAARGVCEEAGGGAGKSVGGGSAGEEGGRGEEGAGRRAAPRRGGGQGGRGGRGRAEAPPAVQGRGPGKAPRRRAAGGRGSRRDGAFARSGRQATSMFSDYRDALARAIELSMLETQKPAASSQRA